MHCFTVAASAFALISTMADAADACGSHGRSSGYSGGGGHLSRVQGHVDRPSYAGAGRAAPQASATDCTPASPCIRPHGGRYYFAASGTKRYPLR